MNTSRARGPYNRAFSSSNRAARPLAVLLAVCCCLSAVNAQWLETTIYLPDSSLPQALCHNPTDNKVYCANRESDNVTVIDGATNTVIATVDAGDGPYALCYNPTNNKVYCANVQGDNVAVIDGATNGVVTTIPVGRAPVDFCHNPAQNRIYVANCEGSSISVLRDTGIGGVEEGLESQAASPRLGPTVVRSVVLFENTNGDRREAKGELLDISGRKVMDLLPGANDVRALAPGVYFVRTAQAQAQAQAVRKVVVTR